MTIKKYRCKSVIQAEEIQQSGTISTSNGPQYAHKGDFLVYGLVSTYIVSRELFLQENEEVPESEEFNPAGKSATDVIQFMRENPDQVSRVKALENEGGKRKTILEF